MIRFFLLLVFPVGMIPFSSREACFSVDEIVWNSARKLSWDDFKGIPKRKNLTGAVTYATIKAKPKVTGVFNDRVEVEVQAIFRCDRSWVLEEARDSKYLLNHEQRHFDIAEVYAARIRAALADLNITPKSYPEIRSQIIEKLFEEYVEFDEAYDKLTIHGLDKKAQASWDRKIDKQLGLSQTR